MSDSDQTMAPGSLAARTLIPLLRMSLEYFRLFVSFLCAGKALAICSSIFIDDCVFCEKVGDVAGWTKPSRIFSVHSDGNTREHLTVCFSGADSQSYRRRSPSKGPLESRDSSAKRP